MPIRLSTYFLGEILQARIAQADIFKKRKKKTNQENFTQQSSPSEMKEQ